MMSIDTTRTPAASFGRRAFLKGSAATLGLAALTGAGCAPNQQVEEDEGASQAPEEQVYQGICRGNCGGGCCMNVHVREGKVVKTSVQRRENPLDERICQRGLTQPQRVYAPERVQYPMRRVEGSARGAGEWERLSWDEAIEYICSKWKGYIEEFGPSSIAQTYGAGTYAYNYFVYMRLFNLMGGTTFEQGYDMSALAQGWRMYGMATYLIGNAPRDVVNSKYIFTWGANSTISQMMRWPYLMEAVKNGAKHIVIDPIYTDSAAKADLWVPIKPGTDGALALAMTNTVIEEGLQDEAYLAKHTVAPFLVKADTNKFLRMSDLGTEPTEGPVNPMTGQPTVIDPIVVMGADGKHGIVEEVSEPAIKGTFDIGGHRVTTAYDKLVERVAEWTPEKAEEICDVPADTIRELTRMYAEGPTNLNLGFGNDHWGNGASITHCQLMLPLITGQIGKPGTGVGGSQGSSSSGWADANMAGLLFPEGAVGGLSSSLLYLPMIMETGMYGENPLPIKSLFNYCSNPLACHTDRNALIEAFDKIELFVNVDTIMTDTARYADVILPAPHWFEYETISSTPGQTCDFNEKAIDPQFECKEDVEIARLLGLGMGFDAMDITTDDFHNILLDSDGIRSIGLDLETLKDKKRVQIFPDEYNYGTDETPFVTTTGRAEFFLEDVAPKYNYGQELDTVLLSLPFYEEPIEAYDGNPLKEQYPLTIITHRDKFKVHSTFALSPILTELQPEPTIEINPSDAQERGIAEGDAVRAFNDRGSVVMKAHLDAGMRPGVVWTEHTWLQEQYAEGHYSELTSVATKHYFPSNHPFDTLCQIEKA